MSKIIAHRGFSSKKLENTMDSFLLAFNDDQIDMIELDIRMTKDEKIVCIHDGFIKVKKNKKEYIKNMTYEELKKPIIKNRDFFIHFFRYVSDYRSIFNLVRLLRYKKKKGTIPLLSDVLNVLPIDKEVIIEIKGSRTDYIDDLYEDKIIEVIDKFKDKKISIMSFDKNIVLNIKKKRPDLKYGILIKKNVEDINLDLDFISIISSKATHKMIKTILNMDKEVIVWTVNTYSDFLFFKNHAKDLIGKIGITTDYPDLIYHLIKKNNKKISTRT